MKKRLTINGLDANLLLFALDLYCGTDHTGHVTHGEPGYSLSQIQKLRDRLFGAHEHPKDED